MEPSSNAAGALAGPGIVQVLADDVINQIAAGEVVERPASVVKELLDNALDAGAHSITVECEAGGKVRLRVTDDGAGMSPADAQRCFLRHATSKIRALADLEELATMGFRGEALASIASVSRTTLTTRRAADLAATRVVLEHGRVVSVSEVGAAPGTTVEVSELFGNVPARLKFLKGEATEASHVTEAVSRLAMAHPHVHFRLRHNGRAVIDVPPDRDGFARAVALLGARLGQRLHRVHGQEQGFAVEAFLAAPELAQTTARGVQLFVGRRAVRDRGLLHAVTMGYGELVARGRYPVAIVLVDAPAGHVDFNVHPQKSEVRFADASAAAAAVRHVVRAGVAGAPWLSESPAAATLHMTVRTSAPLRPTALGAGPPGDAAGDGLASALAHRYAAHLERGASPQLRLDRPEAPRQPPWSEPPRQASHLAEGPARWAAAVRATRSERSEPTLGAGAAANERGGSSRELPPAAPDRQGAGTRAVVERDELAAELAELARAAEAGEVPAPPSAGSLVEPAPAAPAAPAAPSLGAARPVEATLGLDDRGAPQSELGAAWRAPAARLPDAAGAASAAPTPAAPLADPPRSAGFFSSLRYLGQLQLTYLVCESKGELVLLDQHAAHERVEYQKLVDRRSRREGVATQRLLFPTTIELSPAHAAVVEEVSALWGQLGFELEPFGRASLAIKAVPADLRGDDPVQVLRELLDDWVEAGASRAVESRLSNLLATIACHCAVRAGDRLSPREVESLLAAMDDIDFRAHCPHGRPVLLRLSLDEIARRFGR